MLTVGAIAILMKLRQWQQRKKKTIGLMSKTSILNQQEC